eukprot:14611432-Alexandrium_andersonii.AAC.1
MSLARHFRSCSLDLPASREHSLETVAAVSSEHSLEYVAGLTIPQSVAAIKNSRAHQCTRAAEVVHESHQCWHGQ